MKIEFDPVKNAKNIEERNLPFELVTNLDWETSNTYEDAREEYPERRYITFAY